MTAMTAAPSVKLVPSSDLSRIPRDPLNGWLRYFARAEEAADWFHIEVVLRSYGRWLVRMATDRRDRFALAALREVRDKLLAATAHDRVEYTGPTEETPVNRMDDWDAFDFAAYLAELPM
jgi:hypothetical protein